MINDIEEYIDPALEQGSERIRRSNTDRERKKDIKHRERHSARKQSTKNEEAGETHRCRVVASEGANFIVRNEAHVESRARTIKSTHSGNSNATLVVVGDEVIIAPGENDISIIREILPRKTKLSRRAHKRRDSFEQVIASNIDILAIVMSAGDPPFQNGILDKYIIAGLEGGLNILIVLNKVDELQENPRRHFIKEATDYYQKLGYPVIATSAITASGVDDLKNLFENKIAVFAGKSGVGKSSLVNTMLGEEVARTNELSRKEQRGMHTTTNALLHPISGVTNGFIVDTPGIREFFHFELDPDTIKFHFVEFLELQKDCAMTNCMHIHEPGCAVMEEVEEGHIPEWRYNSYIGLWEDAERERKNRSNGI